MGVFDRIKSAVAGAIPVEDDLDMGNSQRMKNLPAPEDPSDAVSASEAQSKADTAEANAESYADDNFATPAEAADAAPVDSVNGQTGDVTVDTASDYSELSGTPSVAVTDTMVTRVSQTPDKNEYQSHTISYTFDETTGNGRQLYIDTDQAIQVNTNEGYLEPSCTTPSNKTYDLGRGTGTFSVTITWCSGSYGSVTIEIRSKKGLPLA